MKIKFLLFVFFLVVPITVYAQTYSVERVIDGDTLKLTNGERVRLIGIDCPESKPNAKAKRDSERTGKDLETINKMGVEATGFVKSLIKEGQEVELEFDVQKKDRYGRTLAYVWFYSGCSDSPQCSVSDIMYPEFYYANPNKQKQGRYGSDVGISLNATIIKAGYASPMTIPPDVKYAELFKKLYEEARENKRGLRKKDLLRVHKVCTAEAKLCPDGSAVGRSGPNCEFEPCPGK